MEERHVLENNGVVLEHVVLIVSTFNSLALNCLDVILELFLFFIFKLSEISLNEAKILSGEGSYLDFDLGVKQELNSTFVVRLDLSDTMLLCNDRRNSLLDRFFGFFESMYLRTDNSSLATDKFLDLGTLKELVLDLLQKPVLIGDVKLVFEPRAPCVLGVKGFHASQESVLEVLLGNSKALYLLKSAGLLFPLGSCDLESLVLGLDASNLALDFLLPAFPFLSLAFVGTVLETSNLIKLSFLFDLKQCLFYGF